MKVSYENVWGCRFLLYGAALSVCIFGAQTQFRFVVFQVKQLLGVERSTALPDNINETQETFKEMSEKNVRCVSNYRDATEYDTCKARALVSTIK